jgi:magnesium transporter
VTRLFTRGRYDAPWRPCAPTPAQNSLADILRLLERHRVLDSLAQQQGRRRDMLEHQQHRQNLAELNRRLRTMHAADVTDVLEAMPPGDRQTIWEQVSLEHAGDVFVQLSAAVRQSLVESTPRETLLAMLARLDPEDPSYVWPSLPRDVLDEVTQVLQSVDRSVFDLRRRRATGPPRRRASSAG